MSVKFLSSLQAISLEKDILNSDGKVIATRGSNVIILPQTVAQAVLVENDKSLAELWPTVSKIDHGHEEYSNILADYQAQLVRLADRITQAEIKFAIS